MGFVGCLGQGLCKIHNTVLCTRLLNPMYRLLRRTLVRSENN